MKRFAIVRTFAVAAALAPAAVFATAGPSSAQVAISLSVGFAPPALPVYTQPPCPAAGYLWTPGYWNYANSGYFWVPGAWAQPPSVGLLWTPPYWGFAGGAYGFHAGYWGPTVGFYGGVNYGFGFFGTGFAGGYWHGSNFYYNRAVANVNVNDVHNTYVNNNYNHYNDSSHVSYNGGPHGIATRPTAAQTAYANAHHYGPTSSQVSRVSTARGMHSQYASAGGHPGTLAMQSDRSGFGHGNEVNTRQGNQQSRIAHGVQHGGITPGGATNLENRENSIHSEAQSDRAANGGSLTGAEKQQINNRQNRVSNSIYNDRHNGVNDTTAAAKHGTTPQQEHQAAHQVRQSDRPVGPHQGGDGRGH